MSLAAEVCAQNHQNFMNFHLTFKQLVTNAKTVFVQWLCVFIQVNIMLMVTIKATNNIYRNNNPKCFTFM